MHRSQPRCCAAHCSPLGGAASLLLIGGLIMTGWRRQGDRSPLRPGARTSPRTASPSRSPDLRSNLSGKCRRPVRSAARYERVTAVGFIAGYHWSFSEVGPAKPRAAPLWPLEHWGAKPPEKNGHFYTNSPEEVVL